VRQETSKRMTPRQHALLLSPLAALLVPVLFWPAAVGLARSFTDYGPGQLSVRPVGVQNFAAVLGSEQVQFAFRNILIVLLVAVPAELAMGLAMASALRTPFLGRGLVRIALLIPWLLSPIAVGVMWHFLYGPVGILDYAAAWLGLPPAPSPLALPQWALPAVIATEIWRKAPLAAFFLVPGVLAIPSEQWEHAILDGTSLAAQVRHVLIPRLRPLLLTVVLLLVGDTLGMFDTVLMMTGGGPGSETLTPALYSYQQAFGAYNWPFGLATAWVIVAIVLLLGFGYVALTRSTEW
jgi:multiple sugar transport system permease protein